LAAYCIFPIEKKGEERLDTSLGICSFVKTDALEKKVISTLGNELDYFCVQKNCDRGRDIYYFCINSQNVLSKEIIAKNLSEWIMESFEQKILSDIFDVYFDGAEINKWDIIQKTVAKKDTYKENYYNRYFVKKLTKYLEEENYINMEGFIRFRLSDYRWKLYDRLCETIEEYYIEQEYKEFVSLLKMYIDERPPMIDLLHIKPCHDGNFSLYDFRKEKIDISIEKNSSCNQIEFFLTKDDMLLSILIALTPRRIIWHNTEILKNNNLQNTLKEVFGDRFSICDECDFCKK